MLSKRKRAAGCKQEDAKQLFHKYKTCQKVSRYGTHQVLRWLVLSQQHSLLDDPCCPMANINVNVPLCTVDECYEMEQHVVSVAENGDLSYIKYAAAFFAWYFKIAELRQLPEFASSPEECSWLSIRDLERSLVVPDVRRSAIKIAQMLELRAGERETVQNKSYSSALQHLRTGEWNAKMHETLMYGTATDIYHLGLLDSVLMAIVEGRYRGRLNFLWVDSVIHAPARAAQTGAWPVIYVHGTHYIVTWLNKQATCTTFHAAYCTWTKVCINQGGVIAGRFDVRKCL